MMVGAIANWCRANHVSEIEADWMWEVLKDYPPPSTPTEFNTQMREALPAARKALADFTKSLDTP